MKRKLIQGIALTGLLTSVAVIANDIRTNIQYESRHQMETGCHPHKKSEEPSPEEKRFIIASAAGFPCYMTLAYLYLPQRRQNKLK